MTTYGPVTCFVIVPAGKAHRSLRRYQASHKVNVVPWEHEPCAASGMGYHNAHTPLEDVPATYAEHGDHFCWHYERDEEPSAEDPRWPKACACGYVFRPEDERQVFHAIVWRADDGREWSDRELPPGALRDVAFMGYDGFMPKPSPDGKALFVTLPCGHDWFVDGEANNGPMGWTRTGTTPAITVSPSILCTCGYHGWLRAGVLTSV